MKPDYLLWLAVFLCIMAGMVSWGELMPPLTGAGDVKSDNFLWLNGQ